MPDELAEAEGKVRAFLATHGDDNVERVLTEYDRRGAELERQRTAVLAIADQLDHNLPGIFRSETANRLREALGESS